MVSKLRLSLLLFMWHISRTMIIYKIYVCININANVNFDNHMPFKFPFAKRWHVGNVELATMKYWSSLCFPWFVMKSAWCHCVFGSILLTTHTFSPHKADAWISGCVHSLKTYVIPTGLLVSAELKMTPVKVQLYVQLSNCYLRGFFKKKILHSTDIVDGHSEK